MLNAFNGMRRAFSDAALQYDALTSLHKEIGRELIARVRERENAARILETGMGTGWLTGKIAFNFPGSLVVGLDFAEGMVAQAHKAGEGFRVVQADAHYLPFRAETFDIVISNLAYQWMRDLPQALAGCRRVLNRGGVLALNLFGYDTFRELFIALDAADEKKKLHVHRLPGRDEVREGFVRAGFPHAQLDEERIKVRFPDMMELLGWTKDIGANRLSRSGFIGRDLLIRANDYYERHFRDRFGVTATVHVIWASAEKKD